MGLSRLRWLAVCAFCALTVFTVEVTAQLASGVAQNLPNAVNYPGQTVFASGQLGYYPERPNLVEYGPENGDQEISSNQQANGMTINLYQYFPFYSGKYNYTMISTSGFIGFAHFSDNAHDFRVGMDTDWPRESDPAVIAPYLCRQRVDSSQGTHSKVYYRVEMRSQGGTAATGYQQQRFPCRGKKDYVQCNRFSDLFLDNMQRMLQTGVAGASVFRAEAALVVTWENLKPNIGKERSLSTYQLVWLTDALGTLSYTIINYDKLGYDAADMNGATVTGRCQALFNGGNHTGTVMVDLSLSTKERPSSLMERSAVPHVVRGRYLHRVDDIVRPAGCSNKTGGSFPLNIYPNIVNMLGQMIVEVNGMCLNPTVTYVLMIEQRETASCEVLNPSVARCQLPKILDWGTKAVYFQPLSGLAHDEKAYIGYIYFVPPTIDPMRLDIGNVHDWFHNPVRDDKELVWYPRNFTNSQYLSGGTGGTPSVVDPNNPALYSLQLGLYAIGYKEARDDAVKKFRPIHRVLARLATYQNQGDETYRWNPQKARIHLSQVEQWYLNDYEKEHDLFTYRFGYLKLSPLPPTETGTSQEITDLPTGLISAPISLHWLWAVRYGASLGTTADEVERQKQFVKKKATEMCHSWFDEDGALPNFIRETETNSSCPCKEDQAKLDLGRYMPHPRCSQLFRDVTCTETLGSRNCYMTAQNVRGAHYDTSQPVGHESSYATHYGQVCCYDDQGYLMQTSYQPVIKIDDSTPYSPGFPMRAYEFGTTPYQGMFEVPGMSAFHHDMMPYYLCCKYADFRCQMFYWRRPSSACQGYEPPAVGTIMGAGVITTVQKQKLIFNDPGVYSLLQARKTTATPDVRIQGRFERFPDRSVDFSAVNQEQWKLVQPSNVTVLTGVALECSDSDRVHVILRKDTRRSRYRTTVLVNDVVRYFDNMQLQRFRGVTIYVNNVQRGQSEVYVVLDKAQIGVRIRESYAIDMDRIPSYMESFGLLDLVVSLPPQYHAVTSGRDAPSLFDVGNDLDGLLTPRGEVVISTDYEPSLTWSDVNAKNMEYRQRYRIKGEAELTSIQTSVRSMSGYPTTDMFETPTENAFSVLPDANMKRPVYVADVHFQTVLTPENQQSFNLFIQKCLNWNADYDFNRSPEIRRCPISIAAIQKECDTDVVCLFDSVYLQARLLGEQAKEQLNSFVDQRHLATIHYNSCGAIALEYPEYMMKGPSSASPAYLEGDVVSFSCFQDHVSMGDTEYQCTKRYSHSDPNSFVMRWNEGGQPWCRSRQKDNFLTWLFWIGILLGSISLLIVIFVVCWSVKQRRRKAQTRRNSPVSLSKNDDMVFRDDESESIPLKPTARFIRNQNRQSPSTSLTETSPFSPIDKPPMTRRSNSQPFLYDDHVPRYAASHQPSYGFSTPQAQPRRTSHGTLSGLSTGV